MDGDSKPKTLKEMQKELPTSVDVIGRLAIAQLAEDYEAAMLSASLLEYMLIQGITTKFIPLGNDHLDSIFSDAGNGPICTFSAKIKLTYALGIVSADTRVQTEIIKDVRNHFAHHKDRVSFEHPIVMAKCALFKQPKILNNEGEILRSSVTLTSKVIRQDMFMGIISIR
jgi:hypothetical protein